MYESIRKRVIELANYMLESKLTIREIAKKFGISKSTVHKDLSERLMYIDTSLYKEINKILTEHKEIRHIRGGQSTKIKYLSLKEGR